MAAIVKLGSHKMNFQRQQGAFKVALTPSRLKILESAISRRQREMIQVILTIRHSRP